MPKITAKFQWDHPMGVPNRDAVG